MSSTLKPREYLRGHEEALVDALAFQHIPSGAWCTFLTPPLEDASRRGETEFVDKLLYAGALFGRAFDLASEARQWGVVRVLTSHLLMRQKTIVYHDMSRDDEAPRSIRVASRDVMEGLLTSTLRCAAGQNKASIVKDLLSAGAGVKSGGALHAAVDSGFLPPVSLIARDAGGFAAVRALNSSGKTPLYVAAERGYKDIAAELLACRADVNAKSVPGGLTALHRAVRKRHLSVTQLLLCHPDVCVEAAGGSRDETALHIAALNTVAVVQALVDGGADVNARDRGMATPLHNAAINLTASECARVIGVLLEARADVNAVTMGGRTALMRACSCVNVVAVRTLLCLGNADETLENLDGKKAIDMVGGALPQDGVDAVDSQEIFSLLLRAPTERMWRQRLPVLALRYGQDLFCRVHETKAKLVAAEAKSTETAFRTAVAVAKAGSESAEAAEARSAEADAKSVYGKAAEEVAEAAAKAARVDSKRRRIDMGPTHGGAGILATDNGVMIWVVRTASPEIFRYLMSFV